MTDDHRPRTTDTHFDAAVRGDEKALQCVAASARKGGA